MTSKRNPARGPERIVAAAVRLEGVVYSLPPPARHNTIIHNWPDILAPLARVRSAPGVTPVAIVIARGEQGFVTNTGRFVGRMQAAFIALFARQIPKLRGPLYSEDLW